MNRLDMINKLHPVLVVEDDMLQADQVETALLALGFKQVDVCLTLKDAEARLETGIYNLIVLDVNLNGHMSFGFAADALRRGCAVVSMSGCLPDVTNVQGTAFMAKPLDFTALPEAICDALELRVESTRGAVG